MSDDKTKQILRSLIERVGEAKGPSRELDCAIFCAATAPESHPAWWTYHGLRSKGLPKDPEGFAKRYAPEYTRSLDAALSLVPEGWLVERVGQLQDGSWIAVLWLLRDPRHVSKRVYSTPSTPYPFVASGALALVLACLRARLSAEETHG